MSLAKHTRNENGTYGPSIKGDYYISKPDHRRTAKKKQTKTRWTIEEGQEYSVFLEANSPKKEWLCEENNCLFSLIDDCNTILGKNGERIAKFPNDKNAEEPWHGYPVLTEESQNRPSSKLLDIIEKKVGLSLAVRLKIEKGLI